MVLIVTTVLGVLAAGFAYTMRVETQLARNATFDAEMEWLGRSGIELARYVLAQEGLGPMGQIDCLNQRWAGGPGADSNSPIASIPMENYQLGNGSFSVKIVDLDRKININAVPRELLRSILTTSIGVTEGVDVIVDSIIEWRERGENGTMQGAKSEDYASNPNPGYPPYVAKDGPIDDMSELLMVRGVTPAIYWGAAVGSHWTTPRLRGSAGAPDEPTYAVGLVDIFSALPTGAKLNINTASAQTLEALVGDPNMVQEMIIRRRAGMDGADGTFDDTPFRSPGEVGFLGAGAGGPMPGMMPGGARPGMMQPGGPGMAPGMPPGMNPMTQIMNMLTVRSLIFEATVEAKIGGRSRKYIALLRRNSPRDVQILNMYWK